MYFKNMHKFWLKQLFDNKVVVSRAEMSSKYSRDFRDYSAEKLKTGNYKVQFEDDDDDDDDCLYDDDGDDDDCLSEKQKSFRYSSYS